MENNYIIGADIGGTTVKIGFFLEDGDLINRFEIPTRKEDNSEHIIPDIAKAIRDKQDELGFDMEHLLGIGVDIPGTVTSTGIVSKCANLGWRDKDVVQELSELMDGKLVRIANDANAAALGEIWRGGAAKHKSAVMVTIGTGVGGGIILDGKIVAGTFGAGGEIGHIKVTDSTERLCGCGKTGCLERYVSALGIQTTAKEIMNRDLTPKDVFDMAKAGDADANKVVDDMTEKLGRSLANISCIIDPEVYILGGGVSNAGQFLLERVKEQYVAHAFYASTEAEFVLAKLGNDAGMFGCAKMIFDSVE